MKILHLETGRHLYGGAQQVLYLLDALREDPSGHLLVAAAGGEPADAARAAGHRVIETGMRGEHDLGFLARIARIMKTEKPDLVHAHSRRGADLLGGLAALRSGIPAVVSRRVDNPEPRWLASVRYRPYRRIVAISHAIEQILLDAGVAPERIVVIPDCVDARPFQGPADRGWLRRELAFAEDAPLLGVVAQLIERKGHRYLLEAMPDILEQHPRVCVAFFGRGPLEETLREEIAARGLAGRVRLAGFRDDMARVLPAIDLLVHTAVAEGLGVALLQAAAARIPVVAFAAGGVTQAVEPGETGILVPPGDAVALGRSVTRLLGDPALARRMGERGRERVLAQFAPERMAARHLRLYRDLLDGGSANG